MCPTCNVAAYFTYVKLEDMVCLDDAVNDFEPPLHSEKGKPTISELIAFADEDIKNAEIMKQVSPVEVQDLCDKCIRYMRAIKQMLIGQHIQEEATKREQSKTN